MRLSRRMFMLGAATTASAAFLRAQVIGATRSINESGFVPIGGIEQWIAIQGDDRRNPVIVFLHGGPGEAESPFLKDFAAWERDFTVVNWDQRGAGKTYGKNGSSTPGMTVDRMAADAVEVSQYAATKLGQHKVILVGHSWGALLGLYVVRRRPDLFYALVGTGQPVSWTLSLESRERAARRKAVAEHDIEALKTLDATAHLPVTDMKRIMASNSVRLSPSDKQYLKGERAFIGSPPFPTKGPVADFIGGENFTGEKIFSTISKIDVRREFPSVPVPYFVIMGRNDQMTGFEPAKQYEQNVHAPIKAFIAIDGGHFACFTDPVQFLAAVRTCVSPLLRAG